MVSTVARHHHHHALSLIHIFNGAGASAISCAAHYVKLGVRIENIVMCDTKGVVYEGRTAGMNPYKARYASTTKAVSYTHLRSCALGLPISTCQFTVRSPSFTSIKKWT